MTERYSYTYNENGELKAKKDFEGNVTAVSYDTRTRTGRTQYADGTESVIVYDECGNVLSATNESGSLSYAYDKAGMLIKETDGKTGETVSYFYDKAGRRTRLISRERDISYGYGRNGEILTQKDRAKRLEIHYKYDACGREIERRFGNGVRQLTFYDKAGRTICIKQVNSSDRLLSGEAYAYDKLGRRSMTVNEKGLVTIYKYDNQSRLETVYYPFNEDIKETARKEADKQGLYFQPSQGTAENYFLSTGELLQLKAVAECIASGRSGAITVNQVVWKESYTYDPNGNRTSKTTSWGTVQYAYDKENRLTESGNLGMSESVKYTYDANGNLLRESAARYRKDYTYNAQNRMSFSDVQDSVLNTRNFTEYAYDAFGRRIETKEYLGDYTRNLYDGFSFDVLGKSVLQSAYSANIPEQMYRTPSTQRHPELVSGSTSNGRNERGTEIGTRYRYIDDTPLVPLSEAAAGGGSSAAAGGAKTRSRASSEYVLYSHGAPAAVNSDDGTSYFGTDILGSVRNVTDKYGAVQSSYNYDAFGSPYLGNLDNGMSFGYTGKAYDAGTGLYDYGFRDYSPVSARFTTIDPIRDGSNWFSYVVNDPVNYVDLFGLQVTAVTPVAGQSSTYLPGGGTNFNGSARGVDQYLASKKETDEWVENAAGHLYNIAKGDWLDDVLYIWDKMTGEKRKEAYKEYQLNFDMQYMQHKQDMKDSGLFDYNNDGRYSEQEASAFAKALNGTYMAPETLAKIRPYKIDTHQMTDREAYEYLNRVEKDSVAISNKLVNEMNSNPANSIPLIMPNITRNTANEESDNKTIINNVIQGLVSISPVINLYSSVSIGCAK